jgi:hypothetical protein
MICTAARKEHCTMTSVLMPKDGSVADAGGDLLVFGTICGVWLVGPVVVPAVLGILAAHKLAIAVGAVSAGARAAVEGGDAEKVLKAAARGAVTKSVGIIAVDVFKHGHK